MGMVPSPLISFDMTIIGVQQIVNASIVHVGTKKRIFFKTYLGKYMELYTVWSEKIVLI